MAHCRCGRDADSPHCTACGSAMVYYRKNASRRERLDDNSLALIRAFQCRRCGQQFFEDQPCAAPPPRRKGQVPRSRTQLDKDAAKIPNLEARMKAAREAVEKLLPGRFLQRPVEAADLPSIETDQVSHHRDVDVDESPNASDEARAKGEYKDGFFGK